MWTMDINSYIYTQHKINFECLYLLEENIHGYHLRYNTQVI